jgi:signal recognition particle GTPase
MGGDIWNQSFGKSTVILMAGLQGSGKQLFH